MVKEERENIAANSGFFMHIAKTAGSYMNDVFSQSLGERFVAHCEGPNQLNKDADVVLWSGHVYLESWRKIEVQRGWTTKRFTLLREPLSQLSSHILWLDHYAGPAVRREYNALDVGSRQVVDEVAATDLSDAGAIDRLFTNLVDRGVMYFDNCQSRYFIAGSSEISRTEPLHLGMRSTLDKALNEFSVVGTDDNIEGFIRRVADELSIDLKYSEKRVNEAKATRSIDLSDPDVRAVLAKRTMLDNWLYKRVQAINLEYSSRL
jgi:hypothetical protein